MSKQTGSVRHLDISDIGLAFEDENCRLEFLLFDRRGRSNNPSALKAYFYIFDDEMKIAGKVIVRSENDEDLLPKLRAAYKKHDRESTEILNAYLVSLDMYYEYL